MRTTAQLTEQLEQSNSAPAAQAVPVLTVPIQPADAKPEDSLYEQILEAAQQQNADKLKAVLQKTGIDLYDVNTERTPVAQLAFENDQDSVYFLIRHGADLAEAAYGFALGAHEKEAYTILEIASKEINYLWTKSKAIRMQPESGKAIVMHDDRQLLITNKMAEGFGRANRLDLCKNLLTYIGKNKDIVVSIKARTALAYGFFMAKQEEFYDTPLDAFKTEANAPPFGYTLDFTEKVELGILRAKARQSNLKEPIAYFQNDMKSIDYVKKETDIWPGGYYYHNYEMLHAYIYEYAIGGHPLSALQFARQLNIYETDQQQEQTLKTICSGLSKRSIDAEMEQFIEDQPADKATVNVYMALELARQNQIDKAHEWLAKIDLTTLETNIPLKVEVLAMTDILKYGTHAKNHFKKMLDAYPSALFVTAIKDFLRPMLDKKAGAQGILKALVMIDNDDLRAKAATSLGQTFNEIISVPEVAIKAEKFRVFMKRENLTFQQTLAWNDLGLLNFIFLGAAALVAKNKISPDLFFHCLSYLTPMKKSEVAEFADRFSKRLLPKRPQAIQWGLSIPKESKNDMPPSTPVPDLAKSSVTLR